MLCLLGLWLPCGTALIRREGERAWESWRIGPARYVCDAVVADRVWGLGGLLQAHALSLTLTERDSHCSMIPFTTVNITKSSSHWRVNSWCNQVHWTVTTVYKFSIILLISSSKFWWHFETHSNQFVFLSAVVGNMNITLCRTFVKNCS